ncbi:MAG: hypothetical protein ACKOCH_23060, partial [Bacteroidota bacterium]
RDRASWVLQQGKIRLVLTTPYHSNSDITSFNTRHGDAVRVIAFQVDDAEKSFHETVKRGARPFMEPTVERDEYGEVVRSGIHTYGDVVHIFVERRKYNGLFLPGYEKWESEYNPSPVGLQYVDHCVGSVGWGEMNTWVKFYEDVLVSVGNHFRHQRRIFGRNILIVERNNYPEAEY